MRPKSCSYFIDNSHKNEKTKGTKKCVIKRKIKFESYKGCFEATQPEIKMNQLQKNKLSAETLEENHKEFI